MKTLEELKQELDVKLHECHCIDMDIVCASQMEEVHTENVLLEELREKENEFYEMAHDFLSLALFTLNDEKVEVLTYPIEIVVDLGISIFDKTTLKSISTIGGEGVVWLTDENGNEINDDDFTVENLATICEKVFNEIKRK